ncbi:MAG: hypothetical protein E2O52_09320 [Gammaproteobacteria bacterium]|nr:MAG: hypothetical protein E2O52_09320 [Gammaproteobacteria bacterium]
MIKSTTTHAPSRPRFRVRTRPGRRQYTPALALPLALALTLSGPAWADDTELFISTEEQDFRCEAPNVVFLIDTSGSMSADVVTQKSFDPDIEYSGCFQSDSIYYGSTGNSPECKSTAHFDKSANQCAAARGTEYTGLFLAWNKEQTRWVKLTEAGDDWSVECAQDEGRHGSDAGDETYAVDGADGPWSDSGTNPVAWGTNASSVTVFDGNYLNWLDDPPTETKTRLEVVQEVTKAALDNMAGVNVALMTFNRTEGGSMIFAAEPLRSALGPLKDAIDDLEARGRTPLSESLYELGQYMAGGNVTFGRSPFGQSTADSRVGGTLDSRTYLSPMNSGGQNNYIVLLTDGGPSNDTGASALIQALPGYAELVGEACSNTIEGDCLDNLAEYLFKADLRPDIEGQQNVITHTIGFTIDLPLLESTAKRGGGKYFIADNTTTLTRALSDLAKDFSRSASILAPPQVPINAFNRSERLDTVYLSVFKPAATQHWPGNLKRYRVTDADNGLLLVDALGRPALDPKTGFFKSDAVSFWSSPIVDGAEAHLGGAASQQPTPALRTLYSNVAGRGLVAVTVDNDDITAALVGAPEAERRSTIEWALGMDVRDEDGDGDFREPRLAMGDPLHTQALTVTYGESELSSNVVVFVMTNDGYLHAIDGVSGAELWAFIPRRLLGRLYELSLGEIAASKQYGLDGALRLIETDDRKLLVFGMRRGGEALFAMDITARAAPALAWIVDSNQPGFADLGQTWSPVQPAKVRIGGNVTDVLLFGGGYDTGQDRNEFRTDTRGNAIYMINAATGALEWSAGSSTARSNHDLELALMNFSIPASLRVIDIDRDGLDDRIYVGDMGGQLWRFDLRNGQPRSSLGEGGVLASLGGAGAGDNPADVDLRRFYNAPDIVEIIDANTIFIAINIGSGYRAHPLNTATHDEFYSVRDFHSREVLASNVYGTERHPVLTREDLLDITDNLTPDLATTAPGWRLAMVQSDGEKILSSSLTISNVLFFNSFTPAASAGSCLPGGGLNRLYRISVLDGAALTNLDQSADDENYTPEDRFVGGAFNQVPLAPMLGPDGVCSGLNCFDGEDAYGVGGGLPGPRANSTYWFPDPRP